MIKIWIYLISLIYKTRFVIASSNWSGISNTTGRVQFWHVKMRKKKQHQHFISTTQEWALELKQSNIEHASIYAKRIQPSAMLRNTQAEEGWRRSNWAIKCSDEEPLALTRKEAEAFVESGKFIAENRLFISMLMLANENSLHGIIWTWKQAISM